MTERLCMICGRAERHCAHFQALDTALAALRDVREMADKGSWMDESAAIDALCSIVARCEAVPGVTPEPEGRNP